MIRTDARPGREGWKQVMPGIYEDSQGATHFSVPELLDLFGVADTPANRQTVIEMARKVAAEMCPGVPVEVRE